MFEGGPLWIPPAVPLPLPSPAPSFVPEKETKPPLLDPTLPVDLVSKFRGKPLNDDDRDHLESLLRGLTIERSSIREAMGFSLDHSESAPEVIIDYGLCN